MQRAQVRLGQICVSTNLAGIKRKLQRPAKNLEWQAEITENAQPHDQEAPEVPQKHYFGPA